MQTSSNLRADLQHHLVQITQGTKLFLTPIPKGKTLHNVLDAGTGTGIWAIDFADEHPESQVRIPPSLLLAQTKHLPGHWCRSESYTTQLVNIPTR